MDRVKLGKGVSILSDITRGKATYPVISECPVCHHDLVVEKLHCENCDTHVEGRFTLSKFNYLDTEKLYFIEVFVKNRGNIKAIEKEMDFSYPTIKKMLDEVITQLGYSLDQNAEEVKPEEPTEPKMSRVEILSKINNGELTVDEAAKLLKNIK
ncbi:MAG: DUF2089 domain-containing protein [Firmicutes bacterium]|nr:DUF2089 domain-containing protein [Bacillota bacterium]